MSDLRSSLQSREVPSWLVIGVGVLLLALVGVWGWHAATATEPSAGPPIAVHPGMYDLRAEAAKHAAASDGTSGTAPSKMAGE